MDIKINLLKLQSELQAAGLPVCSVRDGNEQKSGHRKCHDPVN